MECSGCGALRQACPTRSRARPKVPTSFLRKRQIHVRSIRASYQISFTPDKLHIRHTEASYSRRVRCRPRGLKAVARRTRSPARPKVPTHICRLMYDAR
eukprot:2988209-Rhodomonas_salina.1